MSITFMLHSIAFLQPLIKDTQEQKWRILVGMQKIGCWVLSWSCSVTQCREMDCVVRLWQAQWLGDPQLHPFYKSKLHKLLHMAYNYVVVCPVRVGWCFRQEMFLREVKRGARDSNQLNVCLSVAMSIAKRQSWEWKDPKAGFGALGESGSEVIDESHPLWGQLGWLHDSEQDSAQLTWYTSLRYEGRRVTKGTFAMYQTAEAGEPMVAVVINPLQVDSEWCLVVNDFAKYPDGSTVMHRDSHCCIHQQLLVNELVVVRLLEGIQFTPFVGVQWPDEIVALVPEH